MALIVMPSLLSKRPWARIRARCEASFFIVLSKSVRCCSVRGRTYLTLIALKIGVTCHIALELSREILYQKTFGRALKLSAIAEVDRKGRRVKDLRRLMNHPDLWMQAYLNIQGNKGALTRGTDTVTMDGYSPERAANLVELIRERRYKPKPVRRHRIPTTVA